VALLSVNQSISVFIKSSKEKGIKATAKGMGGQIKLTAYTIPAYHTTHTHKLTKIDTLQTNFKRI